MPFADRFFKSEEGRSLLYKLLCEYLTILLLSFCSLASQIWKWKLRLWITEKGYARQKGNIINSIEY